MKAKGILNKELSAAIADMGHEQIMIIGDAGIPVSNPAARIDLAIAEELPSMIQILGLVMDEMIYERVIVAEEQKRYNPRHFEAVSKLSKKCRVETMVHKELFETYLGKAKYIVRTGGFEPFGNIILQSGIDAGRWFEKEGCIIPGYYEERVEFSGK